MFLFLFWLENVSHTVTLFLSAYYHSTGKIKPIQPYKPTPQNYKATKTRGGKQNFYWRHFHYNHHSSLHHSLLFFSLWHVSITKKKQVRKGFNPSTASSHSPHKKNTYIILFFSSFLVHHQQQNNNKDIANILTVHEECPWNLWVFPFSIITAV